MISFIPISPSTQITVISFIFLFFYVFRILKQYLLLSFRLLLYLILHILILLSSLTEKLVVSIKMSR